MSLRAIRKIQREQEEREKANNPTPDPESSDEAPQKPPIRNAFDMLAEADDGETEPGNATSESDHENIPGEIPDASARTTPSKSKKKKKRQSQKKKKSNIEAGKTDQGENEVKNLRARGGTFQLDEIDLAPKSLPKASRNSSPMAPKTAVEDGDAQLNRLLAVDSKHLNALNEMKRLFGNIIVEGENGGASARPGRRRGRELRELDLAEALTGRHSPASNGQGLSGLALRRNFFIMGKEEWPKAGSGGLGMEPDNGVGHRFCHSDAYRRVQAQFEMSVAIMDPQRMIELLRQNRKSIKSLQYVVDLYLAYHISTLLQVSEIAKQQGDHSISGDLLERALFSFGRSVSSSFTTALSQGKARLDFRRPENREFWLAAWRYIANLGQRGTWQTAYEWARLLLSLDPENDPYRVVLVLDQLALRAGQSEHFLNLSQCSFFQERWRDCPNIHISSALARFKAKEAAKSRIMLAKCVQRYPWIFTRLLNELNIEPVPPSLWGISARSEREEFESEMYIISAKELWENSDAKSFLVEVTKSVTVGALPVPRVDQLSIDETRHIFLSGNQALASLASTAFTSQSISASDPLPPEDDNPSYLFEFEASGHPPPYLFHQGELEDNHPSNSSSEGGAQEAAPTSTEIQNEDLEGFAVLQYFLQNFLHRMAPSSQEGFDTDPTTMSQRLAEFVQFGSRIPEYLATHGRRLVETLRNTWGTEAGSGPREIQYLTNRLDEALTAREPEDHVQGDREPEDRAPTNPPSPMPHHPSVLATGEIPDVLPPYPSAPEHSSSRTQEAEDDIDENSDDDDDDQNQRWLAGKGMLRLRDFTARYGTDETAWSEDPEVEAEGRAIVNRYADRVVKLGQQRIRLFIMKYVLPQGTTVEVRELVLRAIQKISHDRGIDVNI